MLFSEDIFNEALLESSCLHKGQDSAKQAPKITHSLANVMIIPNIVRMGLEDIHDSSSSRDWSWCFISCEAVVSWWRDHCSWVRNTPVQGRQSKHQCFSEGASGRAGDVCGQYSEHMQLQHSPLYLNVAWIHCSTTTAQAGQDFVCVCQGKSALRKKKWRGMFGSFYICSFFFSFLLKKCFSEWLCIVNGHFNSFFSTKCDVLFQVFKKYLFWKGGSVALKEIKPHAKLFMFLRILQIPHSQKSNVLITHCCTK